MDKAVGHVFNRRAYKVGGAYTTGGKGLKYEAKGEGDGEQDGVGGLRRGS